MATEKKQSFLGGAAVLAFGIMAVKVIGADGPVLDAAVPVRQLLEQLVAKTGLPPRSCSV